VWERCPSLKNSPKASFVCVLDCWIGGVTARAADGDAEMVHGSIAAASAAGPSPAALQVSERFPSLKNSPKVALVCVLDCYVGGSTFGAVADDAGGADMDDSKSAAAAGQSPALFIKMSTFVMHQLLTVCAAMCPLYC
jgi:hypothetical protein